MSRRVKNCKLLDGIYHGRKMVRGKEYTVSLETADAREAQRRVRGWIDDLKSQRWKAKGVTKSVEDAISMAKTIHWPRIQESTQRRYESSLGQMEFLDGRKLDDITPADLQLYEAARRRAGITAPTIRRDLQALSVIYEVAIDAEWTERNPAKTYLTKAAKRGLRENSGRTRIATFAESADIVTAILRMPARTDHTKIMTAAFTVIALETGLRADELARMRRCWVDLDHRRELYVPKELAKRNKARWVPLRPLAAECFRRLFESYPCPLEGADYVFWSERTGQPLSHSLLYKTFVEAADIASITPAICLHDLRRTCGARLLRDGVSIEVVSAWLGHSDIGVTQRHYAFLNVDNLHKAVGTLQIAEDKREISLTFLGKKSGNWRVADSQVVDLQALS